MIFNIDEYSDVDYNKGKLTNSEWREFYSSLGALERGLWFPQTSDGDYIFETQNKLIFTDGNYKNPKVNSVVVFENIDDEDIEYGKEMAFYAAYKGQSSEECYEAIRDVLGQEYVTRTNPYPDKADQRSKNNKGKRRSSTETDRGTEPGIRYSLKEDGVPDLFEALEEADSFDAEMPAKTTPSNGVRADRKMASQATAEENRWKDKDATDNTAPEEIPSISELIADIGKAFGVTIKSGKVMVKDARGVYKVKPEVVRTKVATDL